MRHRSASLAAALAAVLTLAGCNNAPAEPSFTLGGGSLTVRAGAAGSLTVSAAFAPGSSGSVALRLEAPSGITGSFAPASLSGSASSSTLTVSVASGVALQAYTLTVRAGSKSAPVTLTVIDATAPTLEASGGTLNAGGASPGTFAAFKFLRPNGSAVSESYSIQVQGPTGWNNNQTASSGPYQFTSGAGLFFATGIAAVNGTYTMTATLGGQSFSDTFTVDTAQTLPQPGGITITSATTSQIQANWGAVAGAGLYFAAVANSSGTVLAANYSTTPSISLSISPALDANAQHTLRVYALAGNLSAANPTIPAPANASRRDAAIVLGGGGFNIQFRVNGTLTATEQATFDDARTRWQAIITQGFTAVTSANVPANSCGAGFPAFSGTIDDVLIDVRITAIDGPSNVLG